MTCEDFEKMLQGGETDRVEFKIECLAFQPKCPDAESAKAELARDVCALANNRPGPSFLVIGVADNGQDFKSVTNPELTDENLQAFFREAVSPPPRVKLASVELGPSRGRHAGKRCVVIQIGPHEHQVFRLNRDFISPHNSPTKTRYHFRRNEVWIRRGATTDLASPEEVVAMSSATPEKPLPLSQNDGRSLIRRLFFGKNPSPAEAVAQRFLALFKEHGVAETQIQQFLPEITLDKIHRAEALMATLTDDILNRAANLFQVRREWLDGVDDRIYDGWFCYKAPERFFEELARIKQDYDSFPVCALYTGRLLDRTDDHVQPLALLMVEKLRDLGEVEICRYRICLDAWYWGEAPCRIQLKAMARVLDRTFSKIFPLYAVEPDVLEAVQEGKLIPRRHLRGSPVTEPSLEDYALSEAESKVAKECEELPEVLEYIKSHNLEAIALGQDHG